MEDTLNLCLKASAHVKGWTGAGNVEVWGPRWIP